MDFFKVETKNKIDVDKKPRVYFTCHPDDFEKYFKKVCEDFFRTHDCAIYYTDNMTDAITTENKETDLGRNNLFVVPVTFKLLTSPNRAMDEDIPYALASHIPVLPIMMEPGIDEFYSRPDKFGELQYLNPYSTDLTEISYEEKLKKYLESLLISDELAKRVRAAFDAYIFLSYRKKDRKYANELMRLIHSNPECRDIAIWFDEFLTPGESFKENIERILDDCKLFTLLVTPQLLEKVVDENGEERDNYVISTELPLAKKKREEKGTDIFAVEMEKTDKEALSAINISDYVNPKDKAFRDRLLNAISRVAITSNNTPEHNFLIGLAYLEGIDVEVDRNRGVELVTLAANAGLLEATKKLRDMYHGGVAVERNYNLAIKLSEKTIALCKDEFGIDALETIDAYDELAYLYYEIDEYQKSIPLLKKSYILKTELLGKKNSDTLAAMRNYAVGCYLAGKNYSSREECDGKFYFTFGNTALIEESISLFKDLYSIQVEIKGECVESLLSLCYLALACSYSDKWVSIAEDYRQRAYEKIKCMSVSHVEYIDCLIVLAKSYKRVDLEKTLQLNRMAYALSCSVFGSDDLKTVQALVNLADTFSDIGDHKCSENDEYEISGSDEYREAAKLLEEVYYYESKLLGENHVSTLDTLFKLSTIYWNLNEHKSQFEVLQRIYECQSIVFGSSDPRVLQTLEMMADTWYVVGGEYKEAIKLAEKIYNLYCELYGEKHPDTVIALKHVAQTYSDHNDFETAISLYNKIYCLSYEVFGKDGKDTIFALQKLSKCFYQYEQYDNALAICQKVIDIENKNQNCSAAYKKGTMSLMAKIYYELNRRTESFSICDKLQRDGNIPSLAADDIEYIRNLEFENFIGKVEFCEKKFDFTAACSFYEHFLKAIGAVESHESHTIGLRQLNLIRADIYDRIAYCYKMLESYDEAERFYCLAVIIVTTEARNSSSIELHDISINCLGKLARVCEEQGDRDKAEIYYNIQRLMRLERETVQCAQTCNSVIKEKKKDESKNEDYLSPEVRAELKKIFDDIFIPITFEEEKSDCLEWLFDEEYEEILIKSALEEIFRLGMASGLEKDDVDDAKKITLANKNGYTESYVVVDSLALNGEKIFVLRPIKENSDILIASLSKTEDVNGYSLFGVDEFLASLY